MDAIRNVFEAVMLEALAGHECHVFIAGWRLNPNRDMSIDDEAGNPLNERSRDTTAWGLIRRMMFAGVKVRVLLWLPPTRPFEPPPLIAHRAAHFYLMRLMKAADAKVKETRPLPGDDWGVVFLDTRLASEVNRMVPAHHQKFIVVRGNGVNVAFCGGVDLAYSRRDSPPMQGDAQSGPNIPALDHGIRSGVIPPIDWEVNVALPSYPDEMHTDSDLPLTAPIRFGAEFALYGDRQIWHDQHLKLEGPVVSTLENIFQERWIEPAAYYIVKSEDHKLSVDSVVSSSANAIETASLIRTHTIDGRAQYFVAHGVEAVDAVTIDGKIVHRDFYRVVAGYLSFDSAHVDSVSRDRAGQQITIRFHQRRVKALKLGGDVPGSVSISTAKVQVWTTIPLRGQARGAGDGSDRARLVGGEVSWPGAGTLSYDNGDLVPESPYRLGDFSAMAGIAQAIGRARQFVWIFDQYFWSVPCAQLLADRLRLAPALHIVIVIPPWTDMVLGPFIDSQHTLRRDALRILGEPDIANRVAVYVPWYDHAGGHKAIYCHAKTQLFDEELLVCGSCNLNERSFSVDTELVCAVESGEIVRAHYRALWDYFVSPGKNSFPTNFSGAWGAALFRGLSDELKTPGLHHLHTDDGHRFAMPKLPNGLVRSIPRPYGIMQLVTGVNEPRGLSLGLYSGRSLAEIVDALERIDSQERDCRFEPPDFNFSI